MSSFANVAPALAGGLLIGGAVAALWRGSGRIAGISGIVGGLVERRTGETGWRAAFVAGLLLGGLGARLIARDAIGPMTASVSVLAIAGWLVGFGTSLGNGCTSGHGVCGVSRLSPRSLVATLVFILVAGLVVLVVRHGLAA